MSQQDHNFNVPDKRRNGDRPASQLDIYDRAVRPGANDEFLSDTNLGLGNYSDREYWQQVQSFRNGLYAYKAFARRIRERAIEETKLTIAREGWTYIDEDEDISVDINGWTSLEEEEREEKNRREWIRQEAEVIWADLTEEEQATAVAEITGVTRDWTPPHWRLMMMRHEASRSRGARLLDNLFGRVRKILGDADEEDAPDSKLSQLRPNQ